MTKGASDQTLVRLPCASCRQPIFEGARKCKHCKAWQPERARTPRAALLVAVAVSTAFSVIVTTRRSPVGEAPPLTAMGNSTATHQEPSPAAVGPDPAPVANAPAPEERTFRTRELLVGDAHPLDLVFSQDGESLYVSADDASIRAYKVSTGEAIHKATAPAKGDKLRLLFNRYLAVIRPDPRVARVPVLDTAHWDHDPILLTVGLEPTEVMELADGSVVATSGAGRRIARFSLPDGKLLSDMRLPQAIGNIFMVESAGRPYLAALGQLTHSGRPAGAWLDLFDPAEAPFGASRRSIAVGRAPGQGAVTSQGHTVVVPDRASNSLVVVDVAGETRVGSIDVGRAPFAAFVAEGDQHVITLNAGADNASVVRLPGSNPQAFGLLALPLPGAARDAAQSADRRLLFVAMGGREQPPKGSGVCVIGGSPPRLLATLPTGDGALSVAVSPKGDRAAVANYASRTITLVE